MAALGEMTFVSAKQRWKFATGLILSKLKEQKATKNAERLRKRALSLEEQLRRVERHISNAAEDFDNLNKTLEKEREERRTRRCITCRLRRCEWR
jgi:molecular chaperone GrpE (heat shock protein)